MAEQPRIEPDPVADPEGGARPGLRLVDGSAQVPDPETELLALARGAGPDADAAVALLWSRHLPAVRRLARAVVGPVDAHEVDDLVSESFARVLAALRAGGGPRTALRPYWVSTLRRVAVDVARRRRTVLGADGATPEPEPQPSAEHVVAEQEEAVAARLAWASLPEDSRLLLWELVVEGRSPAQVAPVLGVSANAVSSRGTRARERLREAFLSHRLGEPRTPACRLVRPLLGSFAREGLAVRDRVRVETHLAGCLPCRGAVAEARSTAALLRRALLPGALLPGLVPAALAGAGTGGAAVVTGTGAVVAGSGAAVAGSGAAVAGSGAAVAVGAGTTSAGGLFGVAGTAAAAVAATVLAVSGSVTAPAPASPDGSVGPRVTATAPGRPDGAGGAAAGAVASAARADASRTGGARDGGAIGDGAVGGGAPGGGADPTRWSFAPAAGSTTLSGEIPLPGDEARLAGWGRPDRLANAGYPQDPGGPRNPDRRGWSSGPGSGAVSADAPGPVPGPGGPGGRTGDDVSPGRAPTGVGAPYAMGPHDGSGNGRSGSAPGSASSAPWAGPPAVSEVRAHPSPPRPPHPTHPVHPPHPTPSHRAHPGPDAAPGVGHGGRPDAPPGHHR